MSTNFQLKKEGTSLRGGGNVQICQGFFIYVSTHSANMFEHQSDAEYC